MNAWGGNYLDRPRDGGIVEAMSAPEPRKPVRSPRDLTVEDRVRILGEAAVVPEHGESAWLLEAGRDERRLPMARGHGLEGVVVTAATVLVMSLAARLDGGSDPCFEVLDEENCCESTYLDNGYEVICDDDVIITCPYSFTGEHTSNPTVRRFETAKPGAAGYTLSTVNSANDPMTCHALRPRCNGNSTDPESPCVYDPPVIISVACDDIDPAAIATDCTG